MKGIASHVEVTINKRTGELFSILLGLFLLFHSCKPGVLVAPDSATLNVVVVPSQIPVGGEAIVKVTGYKSTGGLLPDGTEIYFSTDIGSIESEKEIQGGVAEAIFKSNDNRSGVATIRVISGNAKTNPETITITIGTSALYSIILMANPASLSPGGGTSTIRVLTYDKLNNPLSNIAVVLSSNAGELSSKGVPIYTGTDGSAQDTLKTSVTTRVTAMAGDLTATVDVTVEDNDAPTASFVYSPESPKINEKIFFNAAQSSDTDGTIESYLWDFGDGTAGTGQTISHSYKNANKYHVVLVVKDNKGAQGTKEVSITVGDNESPTAEFVFSPPSPNVNEDVVFDASDSTDPDGTISSYDWDFNDTKTGHGKLITHKFSQIGTYAVTLRVTDNSGNSSTKTKSVVVSAGQKPVASFDYSPTAPIVGQTVYMNASASYDSDGTITEYRWDYGDGGSGTGVTSSHAYSNSGSFIITLVVRDNDGNETTLNKSVRISSDSYPTASFTYTPSEPTAGQDVFFDATSSKDTDGYITDYKWNFGDGSTAVNGAEYSTITHSFALAGSYKVILIVTDNGGNQTNTYLTVTVK